MGARLIYKYLMHNATQDLFWYPGSIVRHVGADISGTLAIWVEFDLRDMNLNLRTFKAINTGDEIPADWDFIGTAVLPMLDSVVHVYAERKD